MGDDGYECNVTVDGKLSFSQNFKYNGIAENSNDGMKYTVETSLAEVKPFVIGTFIQDCWTNFDFKSRMPGQSFAYTFKDASGAVFKNETVSFHGPGRMIFEEAANDVAMITVYEKQ